MGRAVVARAAAIKGGDQPDAARAAGLRAAHGVGPAGARLVTEQPEDPYVARKRSIDQARRDFHETYNNLPRRRRRKRKPPEPDQAPAEQPVVPAERRWWDR